jgi:hypothetical protein
MRNVTEQVKGKLVADPGQIPGMFVELQGRLITPVALDAAGIF